MEIVEAWSGEVSDNVMVDSQVASLIMSKPVNLVLCWRMMERSFQAVESYRDYYTSQHFVLDFCITVSNLTQDLDESGKGAAYVSKVVRNVVRCLCKAQHCPYRSP